MITTILAFLGILAVLVLAHEIGHLLTAKVTGVRVEEFGLGLPPRLLGIRWRGTLYSLNAVPLGGFTKMAGEDDSSIPDSLASKSVPARLLVLSAGSIMNLLLPLLLFSLALIIPHNVLVGEVIVREVPADSQVAAAGVLENDIILSVNDQPVNNTFDLQRYIELNMGKEIAVQVRHPDTSVEYIELLSRWRPPEGEGSTGLMVSTSNASLLRESEPFWRAIPMAARECVETIILYKNAIIGMVIGSRPVQISGPVGIAQMAGEVVQAGISPLFEFAAFLSINLAIVNLLPLPALDGGRIALVLLEWLRRGKKIPPKKEALIHAIGFAMLMGLILLLTYQDIVRIISGGSLLS